MIKNYVRRILVILPNFTHYKFYSIKLKTYIMEKGNIEIKEEILRKLEDIKNTTESLVVKIGHLQVDLFNYPDKELEKFLDTLNKAFSDKHVLITEVFNKHDEEVNSLKL